jgi:hypothetical protein
VVGARACRRCGLSRHHAEAWAAAQPRPPAELTAAWSAVQKTWTDQDAHDRLSMLALGHAALPWLARRYRAVQQACPGDEIASARLDKIVTMTLAALRASEATRPNPQIRRHAGLAVLAVLVVLVTSALFSARRSSAQQHPRRRPAPAMGTPRPMVQRADARLEVPTTPTPVRDRR